MVIKLVIVILTLVVRSSACNKVLLGNKLEMINPESPSAANALRRKLLTSVLESKWEVCKGAIGEPPKKPGVLGFTTKSLRNALWDGDGPTTVKAILEISKKLSQSARVSQLGRHSQDRLRLIESNRKQGSNLQFQEQLLIALFFHARCRNNKIRQLTSPDKADHILS